MRGPIWIAHKKILSKIEKKLKIDAAKVKRETAKASKQNSGAPKRPPSGFFVFMEDFRKLYKEKFPDNKSVAPVGKAGGEKWKCMPEFEKTPYLATTVRRKAEYEIAMKAFNSKSLIAAPRLIDRLRTVLGTTGHAEYIAGLGTIFSAMCHGLLSSTFPSCFQFPLQALSKPLTKNT